MSQGARLPGFTADAALPRGTRTPYRHARASAPRGPIRLAGCSYYYGTCAGHRELSCEFGDTSGICVGEGYAPVVVTCDGDVSYTEAQCSV